MSRAVRADVRWAWAPGPRKLDHERVGYWRAIIRTRYMDDVWEKVRKAVQREKLGPAARLSHRHGTDRAELRVYVPDLDRGREVEAIRNTMRNELGFRHGIGCYRTDGRLRWRDRGAVVPPVVRADRKPKRKPKPKGKTAPPLRDSRRPPS